MYIDCIGMIRRGTASDEPTGRMGVELIPSTKRLNMTETTFPITTTIIIIIITIISTRTMSPRNQIFIVTAAAIIVIFPALEEEEAKALLAVRQVLNRLTQDPHKQPIGEQKSNLLHQRHRMLN
uniref:Uncharacterized protein n=1 Tax=Cyclophora tenuis TaxID=216820 RepID=A0A6U1R0Q2_CYCTE